MTLQITVSEVKDIYSTDLPNVVVQSLIDVIDEADACLAAYPESIARVAKLYGVAHLLSLSDGGVVESETSHTGASVKYAKHDSKGTGLDSTKYGSIVLGLSCSDCISKVLAKPKRWAKSFSGASL